MSGQGNAVNSPELELGSDEDDSKLHRDTVLETYKQNITNIIMTINIQWWQKESGPPY